MFKDYNNYTLYLLLYLIVVVYLYFDNRMPQISKSYLYLRTGNIVVLVEVIVDGIGLLVGNCNPGFPCNLTGDTGGCFGCVCCGLGETGWIFRACALACVFNLTEGKGEGGALRWVNAWVEILGKSPTLDLATMEGTRGWHCKKARKSVVYQGLFRFFNFSWHRQFPKFTFWKLAVDFRFGC